MHVHRLFNELIAWSGDLAIGPINFVLPLLVTLTALGVRGVVPDSWAATATATAHPHTQELGEGGGHALGAENTINTLKHQRDRRDRGVAQCALYARGARRSLALLVQMYLLTGTRVQILTLEELLQVVRTL
jgi:hypothetical protein